MKRRDFPMIRLAPWEYLPSATRNQIEGRAQSVAEFRWCGEQLQVAARYADCGDGSHFIVVQFLGEADDGNWVMSPTNLPHYPYIFRLLPRLRLAHRLARNFSPRYSGPGRQFPFARLFYIEHEALNSKQPLGICVDIQGHGMCLFPEGHAYSEIFRLPLPERQSLRRVRASDILSLIREELDNDNSDLRFMLAWHEKTDEERDQMVIQTQRGTLAEMHHFLACALYVEPSFGHDYEDVYWLAHEHGSTVYFDHHARFVRAPIRLMVWRRIILQHFNPTINEALRQRHTCVHYWAAGKETDVDVEIERPTQHERLEAALSLREWGRDKMSPRKLQLLLSGV